jgi:multiple sugar transport system substrate-binding protein
MSRKTRTSRPIAVSAALAAAALALAACSSGGSADGGSGGGGSQEVTFWGNWTGEQAAQIESQVEAFNAAQDTYVVTYQPQEEVEAKLLTAIAGGGVPDVVLWDRFQTSVYASKGALMSLEDLIAQDSIDTSIFYEAALNELTYDGTIYGLPLTVDNRSLFYNAEMLAEAGVEPPTTWAELADAAEALTVRDDSGALVRSGFALNDVGLFSMWLGQAGGQMVAEDGTAAFNSPEGLAVLEQWEELMNQRGVYELGFAEGTDGFAEGTVAMSYNGPWMLASYDALETLDYGIVAAPAGPDGDRASGMGGFGLIIPEGAQNAEGAWEFMTWWTTQAENGVAFAEASGNMPANLEAAEDPFFTENEAYAALLETMSFATARPTVPGYSDAEVQGLIPELQRFMAGEITAQEALDNAEESFNRILAENA